MKQRKATIEDKYMIFAMWIGGYSLNEIQILITHQQKVKLSRNQIWGYIKNTPYHRRQYMFDDLRFEHIRKLREWFQSPKPNLKKLWEIAKVTNFIYLRSPKELPVKKILKPQDIPPLKGGIGRDGMLPEIEHFGHLEKATSRDIMTNPLEYLEAVNLLNDPRNAHDSEETFDLAKKAGERRRIHARIYQEVKRGSGGSPLASADLSGIPKGGFNGFTPIEFQVQCAGKIRDWDQQIPRVALRNLEAILSPEKGEFLFLPADDPDSKLVLNRLRMGLDIIAWCRKEVTQDSLFKRWPEYRRWYRIRGPGQKRQVDY